MIAELARAGGFSTGYNTSSHAPPTRERTDMAQHHERLWCNIAPRWMVVAVLMLFAAMPAIGGDQLSRGENLFGKVLDDLTDNNLESQPHLTDLVGELRQYRRHNQQHRQARIDALTKALDEVVQHSEAGDLKKALVAAIEAHSQSLDPQTLLTDPRITTMIGSVEQAATDAAADRDWLEVLSLYRRLNMLFEPRSPYRDQLEKAERRVRILATYAPKRLQMLHLERLERLGKPAPEDQQPEQFEPWELLLKGIRIGMLNDVFADSARHVTSPNVKQLLNGSFDQVLLLTHLPALSETFAGLGDPQRVNAFADFIHSLRTEVSTRRSAMNHRYAKRIIRRVLEKNRRTIGLPEKVMVYEMGEGAAGTLDKFSEIIWPYKVEQFERTTQGNFTGVGIKIELSKDRRIRVVTPMRNTPALRKGIRPNDYIVEVDGQPTTFWSLDKAVRKITGPRGSRVELGIERDGFDETLRFKLTRARIPIDSVLGWKYASPNTWDFYIDREAQIGYVRLIQFIPRSADDLDDAIESMIKSDGLKGLILDLRGNPGGLLTQAIEVANRFVPSGTIVSTVGADDIRTSAYSAKPHKVHPKMEVVVLVNRTSASASEIVAGALQDYGKAVIVGSRTYGKGSVQDLYPLAGNDAVLRLTTQYYKLPAGRIIHREPDDVQWGVDPDVTVDMTDQQVVDLLTLRQELDILPDPNAANAAIEGVKADPQDILAQGKDPQLTAALLTIKTRLLAEEIRLAMGERAFDTP